MISIFFASVVVFIWLFGVGRKMMIEAAKAKQTAKILYNDTHTIYLDGRPYTGDTSFRSHGEGLDHEYVPNPAHGGGLYRSTLQMDSEEVQGKTTRYRRKILGVL